MKAFLSAVFAVAVISVGSWMVLGKNFDASTMEQFTTKSVRLGEAH